MPSPFIDIMNKLFCTEEALSKQQAMRERLGLGGGEVDSYMKKRLEANTELVFKRC